MPSVIVTARLPRFQRRPDAVPNLEKTDRDVEILKIIARHRFITSAQIIALIQVMYPGSSAQKILRRLRVLYHSRYVTRPRAQIEAYKAGAGSGPMVYAIGNAGIDYLAENFGFRRASVDWTAKARTAVRGEIHHALGITDFLVRLEIACRSRGNLEMIHFDEIVAQIAPEATRTAPRPYQWRVPLRWKGSSLVLHPRPDAIFGVRDLERPDGRNRKFFYYEKDRGTMPTARKTLEQTSILRKLVSYAESYRRDLHIKTYNLPNVRILLETTSIERISNIMETFGEHVAALASPRLFLFAEHAGLRSVGDILDHPWLDAAGEPHRLLD